MREMNHTLTIRPAWTPLTHILMVIGFMVLWPLGLAMLAYILWGDRIPEFRRAPGEARHAFSRGWGCGRRFDRGAASSGNVAFDEYRARELRRLDEERRRLDEERRGFEQFMQNLRRARDQEEFDRYMAERRERQRGDSVDL
jgi:hypothetical protein